MVNLKEKIFLNYLPWVLRALQNRQHPLQITQYGIVATDGHRVHCVSHDLGDLTDLRDCVEIPNAIARQLDTLLNSAKKASLIGESTARITTDQWSILLPQPNTNTDIAGAIDRLLDKRNYHCRVTIPSSTLRQQLNPLKKKHVKLSFTVNGLLQIDQNDPIELTYTSLTKSAANFDAHTTVFGQYILDAIAPKSPITLLYFHADPYVPLKIESTTAPTMAYIMPIRV